MLIALAERNISSQQSILNTLSFNTYILKSWDGLYVRTYNERYLDHLTFSLKSWKFLPCCYCRWGLSLMKAKSHPIVVLIFWISINLLGNKCKRVSMRLTCSSKWVGWVGCLRRASRPHRNSSVGHLCLSACMLTWAKFFSLDLW